MFMVTKRVYKNNSGHKTVYTSPRRQHIYGCCIFVSNDNFKPSLEQLFRWSFCSTNVKLESLNKPCTLDGNLELCGHWALCFLSSVRQGDTVLMLQRSTPSTSLMWLEVWPRSVVAAPWCPLRLIPPAFPALQDTTWSEPQECVKAALQTPTSGPASQLESLLASIVAPTQKETK